MLNQIEIFDIPSPCKRVCETDKQGYCLSCFRSRQERFNWMTYDNEQKRDVLRLCKQRDLRRRYQKYQEMKAREQLELLQNDEQLDLF